MDTTTVFILIMAAFAVCVFLGILIVYALRQGKTSRHNGNIANGYLPDGGSGPTPGETTGHANHSHHHHHHHDASQHGSSGHDGGASHGGHSGGFDGGGSHGGGFSGGHH
jgi:hypothetical protein